MLFIFYTAGQITPEESLFVYEPGLGTVNFSHPEHIPVFAKDQNISKEVRDVCNGNTACMYDATATNDTSVGMSTMMTNQALINMRSAASKSLSRASKKLLMYFPARST